ncbi:MAG: hypothetical protein NZ960_00705 [Candidatus Kapabacteria bacterium]|nr:hypothetical protein [Candidatus Kapabacteria bacterium]MDW8011546.1 hypothetical protein [Bacteroidota bacterium]
MKWWALVGGVLCYSLAGRAQQSVLIPFTVANEFGESVVLTVGVDERATDRIDTLLGERELPPLHPPQDAFHAVLRFYDTVDGEWKWTYRDLRPLRSEAFSVEHRILVQRGRGDTVVLQWSYPLPEHVDSAVLSDRVTGILVRFRFDHAQRAVITNRFLEEFVLTIWYRFPSSIEDNVRLELSSRPWCRWIVLYDLMGQQVWQGSGWIPVELQGIGKGVYVATGYDCGGRKVLRFLWRQ